MSSVPSVFGRGPEMSGAFCAWFFFANLDLSSVDLSKGTVVSNRCTLRNCSYNRETHKLEHSLGPRNVRTILGNPGLQRGERREGIWEQEKWGRGGGRGGEGKRERAFPSPFSFPSPFPLLSSFFSLPFPSRPPPRWSPGFPRMCQNMLLPRNGDCQRNILNILKNNCWKLH